MDPIAQMELLKDTFSQTEMKIYKKIIKDPSYVARSGIVGLAEWCDVSQPTITRFCKKIGFKKYTDFKYTMYRYVMMKNNLDQTTDSLPSMFQHYQELLGLAEHVLTKEVMSELSTFILSFKHLFVTGVTESFLPGKLLELKLRKLGLYVSAIQTSELNDIYNYAQEDDLTIVFSMRGGSGTTNMLGKFFNQRESLNGHVLLITMNINSKYKELVDKMVVLPQITLSDTLNQTKTDILFYVFVENLVSYIAYQLNNTIENR
ncbi:MurR/RpiR family transcriptional regulator [Paenibacillus sp. 23TSA30-6]|uniref:MurR/RpiR family transcriptional regulator n=1 Tax=Paenibacillus sp. 23TSA30-6 TaxID=2546104 RepID=UPI001787EDDE|nr:MurR/RpiR family transcriptional regulator [Paenibacillus sp. 23TSA30-6]MBE0339686.1 MurR/RpiR family transcriptional regulator [Paenibacillus sp. 23TSA30-6]